MFKKRNNIRRNAKNKQHKNTKKSPQYVEDYNEVILNDLVVENKIEEEPVRNTKKKKSLNFSLTGKKKTNSSSKNQNNQPEEIIELESKKQEEFTDQQETSKTTKSKKKHSNQDKLQGSKNQLSKGSKSKKQSQQQDENIKKPKNKTSNKQNNQENMNYKNKKSSKKRIKKEDEKVKAKAVDDLQIEGIDGIEEVDENIGGDIFRNISDEELRNENVESFESIKEFENIVWSDDKFPKN